VAEGEVLCEVETDKATFEVPSIVSGTLLRRLFAEGDDVPVMKAFAVVGAPGEEVSARGGGGGVANEGAATAPVATAAGREEAPDLEHLTGKRSVRISPLARHTAAELGIDDGRYPEISGSGPGGRILKSDVEAFAAAAQAVAGAGGTAKAAAGAAGTAPTALPGTGRSAAGAGAGRGRPAEAEVAETKQVAGVRKVIAERMLSSLTTTAQLTLNATAEATALMGYRAKLKQTPEDLGVGDITVNDILMFIVARTVARHPHLNAHYVEGEPDEIRSFRGVNLGFAVDTERGLYVPVIRGADGLSLRELADTAHALAETVHAGKAGPQELSGATFTVTNLGSMGVRDFTPVLNPPEVGILGIGTVRPEQMYGDGEVVTAPHIGLSLTFDHRATDGGPAARLLKAVCTAISHAESVLAL
jgi:pyruvate dehydrogenase E2 component (dihydrolipoamide acetyltransferase)